MKQIETYFKRHPSHNAITHLFLGIGLGILLTYPIVGNHPVRWGSLFVGLGILGHLYPLWIKK